VGADVDTIPPLLATYVASRRDIEMDMICSFT
jgi:hypothetical protein